MFIKVIFKRNRFFSNISLALVVGKRHSPGPYMVRLFLKLPFDLTILFRFFKDGYFDSLFKIYHLPIFFTLWMGKRQHHCHTSFSKLRFWSDLQICNTLHVGPSGHVVILYNVTVHWFPKHVAHFCGDHTCFVCIGLPLLLYRIFILMIDQ